MAAAIATIAFTSFATISLVRVAMPDLRLFNTIWPIVLTSAVAVVLVMSTLYRSLVELVEELERREISAQHQALHDQLTGLANRALLEDRLEQVVGRYRRTGESAALLMLDLDRFKQVNDTLGHVAGDALVQEVGNRLKRLLRETDTVARVGGDEFAILLVEPNGSTNVRAICRSIIRGLAEPFDISGREARVGVSIGAVMTRGEDDAADLLRKADITMYRAKAAGRNCYRIFTDAMDEAVQRRDQIEISLRRALAAGTDLDVHFQPTVSRRGGIEGAEALLRWNDPVLGAISPAEVIPLAEECGLIDQIGEFVFTRACRAALDLPGLVFAINLSPAQFRTKGLPQRLRAIADREGVDLSRLELEITENLLIEHGGVYEREMTELREMGFTIALDDFGTGYSSLSYLSRFPVQKIKLDRSFIGAAHLSHNLAIIRAAVSLGHSLGLVVTAEGVAEEAQERIAIEAGCDSLQGFRYAPALPLDQLATFVREHSATPFPRAA
ncbi:MAG: putative bifunctional diguanylate cyclase/phosphodiesterase [Allosphingosinicella sp.]